MDLIRIIEDRLAGMTSESQGSDSRVPTDIESMPPCRMVYLMRGLPASGKSHLAKQLAGRHGVVCETDRYLIPGGDGENGTLVKARDRNFSDFCHFLRLEKTPVVVDRGNGLNPETYRYVNQAVEQGYRVELIEPDSPWWREIRILMRYRPSTNSILSAWAQTLSRLSGVDITTILDWMDGWVVDLSTRELLEQARLHRDTPPVVSQQAG